MRDAIPPGATRRAALTLGVAAAPVAVLLNGCGSKASGSGVFIARGQRYDRPLEPAIRDGLIAAGLVPARLAGRRVLLKPNLVEPGRDRTHATTHPAMIVAAAEVFRSWGAKVAVGEGPGHIRDTEAVLHDSATAGPLAEARLPFHDLNYEETRRVANRGGTSRLDAFHLPTSVLDADLIVSMPKLKTHHWIGMTAGPAHLNLTQILGGPVAYSPHRGQHVSASS